MTRLKLLDDADREPLERFLAAHADSSMFFRSNIRRAGLGYRGKVAEGQYLAAFDDAGIVGLVGHAWNGIVMLQAAEALADLVPALLAETRRPVAGVIGPLGQTRAALALLERTKPLQLDSAEGLYALDLEALELPPRLARGDLRCRLPEPEDLDLLTEWRHDFAVAELLAQPGPDLRRQSRAQVESTPRETQFILVDAERPVATCNFNAAMPDCVQLGGVWTPEGNRCRGYARAVVAGALDHARRDGVRRAVLFTGDDNHAAQTVYSKLGFARVGDWGVSLFE